MLNVVDIIRLEKPNSEFFNFFIFVNVFMDPLVLCT